MAPNRRTALAGRTIDVFSREELTYRGSLVLPTQSKRIAVRGDSLIVIGERDDYPALSLLIFQRCDTERSGVVKVCTERTPYRPDGFVSQTESRRRDK